MRHVATYTISRAALPLAGLLLAALAGCAGASAPGTNTAPDAAGGTHQPIATTHEADSEMK